MKTFVVEDSRLAREGLLRLLEQFSGLEIVGAAGSVPEALDLIAKHQPQALFLDIHMPGQTGFELLDLLEYTPQVIFTTAYSEYAVRSFDYNPVDYLLKPISSERLAGAIDKLSQPDTQSAGGAFELDSKIFIKDGDDGHLVTLRDIQYFESCKNHTRVYFDNQKPFIRKSLSAIESRLPPHAFFRANRQFVINLSATQAIHEAIGDGFELIMQDGKSIELSRRNASELKNLMSF